MRGGLGAVLLGLVVACECDPGPDPCASVGDVPPSVELGSSGENGAGFVPLTEGQDLELIRGPQGGFHLWFNLRAQGVCFDDLSVERRAFDAETGQMLFFVIEPVDLQPAFALEGAGELRSGRPHILCPNVLNAQVRDRPIRMTARIEDGSRSAEDEIVVTARCDPATQGGEFFELCTVLCAGELPLDAGMPDAGADAGIEPDAGNPCDACVAPMNGVATCTAGVCGFECDPGYAADGATCAPAPRLLAPVSGATATTRRPTLRWDTPDGAGAASLELCRDRACSDVIETIDAGAAESGQPSADLPPASTVYWRVSAGGRPSRTWQFLVPVSSAPVDASWGISPDFDGDGFGDATVGAPQAMASAGRAYVHEGAMTGTPASSTITLAPPDGAGGEFGNALAAAGDLDGDGFGELAIGAPRAAGGAGRLHVYRGGPGGIGPTPRWSIESPDAPGALFGGAIAAAGDVNGDGYGDLAVASPGEAATPGRMHVFLGGPRGPAATPARSLTGTGRFATSVAGAIDLDADGFADLVVGAPGAPTAAGEIHVFHGSATGIAAAATTTRAAPEGGQFGYSVAGAGDVDADGYADLIVGAPSWDDPMTMFADVGRAYVYRGSASGLGMDPATRLGAVTGAGAFFGWSVAGLGDATRDGFADVAIGAFGVSSRNGRVYVHVGSAGGILTAAATSIDSPFGGESDFGWVVASPGDVDRNGYQDLIVGAPRVDSGAGRAYVHRGSTSGVGSTPLVALIGAAGGAFGRALGHADR